MNRLVQFAGAIAFLLWFTFFAGVVWTNGLFSNSAATIVAGLTQAMATAGAIYVIVWQTRKAVEHESSRVREDEQSERLRLYREGSAHIRLAAGRLREISFVLPLGEPTPTDAAREALEAITMHTDALSRFPFERLDPNAAETFEIAFQHALAAKSTLHALRVQVETQIPSHYMATYSDELKACAVELETISELMGRKASLLKEQGLTIVEGGR
jgi:hypothetical protein